MPRRIVKTPKPSIELSPDSSLSSTHSVNEASGLLDIQETAVEEESSFGRSSDRKRRAVTVAKATPAKKAKIIRTDVSTVTPLELNISSPATKTEIEANDYQRPEASSKSIESESKPKALSGKVKAARFDTQRENQIAKTPKKHKRGKKIKKAGDDKEDSKGLEGGEKEEKPLKKIKRARKTKEEKEAEAMPLMARTVGLRMFVGAHVSCAKGSFYCFIYPNIFGGLCSYRRTK